MLVLLTFGLSAQALDNAVFSIDGYAKAQFGVNLMTMATGFRNTLQAKLRLDFKPEATSTMSGMDSGSVYGEIKFDEISIYTKKIDNTDDNDADLEMDIDLEYAKIVGPNWWLSVKGHDDNIDYENAKQNGIIGVAAAWDKQMDNVNNDVGGIGGVEGGFSIPDIASLELSVFSLTDWTAAEADANLYGMKAELILSAVPDLTFKAAANLPFGDATLTTTTAAEYDWIDDDSDASTAPVWGVATAASTTTTTYGMGFGGLLSYALAVSDDISITPEIGVDVKMLDGGGMNMAIGNGLTISLPGDEVKSAEDAVQEYSSSGDSFTSVAWDDGVNSGLTLGWSYYMPNAGEASLGIQAHLGLSMIENLEVAVGFEMNDVMATTNDTGIAAFLKYTAGDIVPRAGVFMLMDDAGADKMVAEAGLAINNILPLTSVFIDWNSGNLQAAEAELGLLSVAVQIDY